MNFLLVGIRTIRKESKGDREMNKYPRFCETCHRISSEFKCCGKRTRRVNLERTIGDRETERAIAY